MKNKLEDFLMKNRVGEEFSSNRLYFNQLLSNIIEKEELDDNDLFKNMSLSYCEILNEEIISLLNDSNHKLLINRCHYISLNENNDENKKINKLIKQLDEEIILLFLENHIKKDCNFFISNHTLDIIENILLNVKNKKDVNLIINENMGSALSLKILEFELINIDKEKPILLNKETLLKCLNNIELKELIYFCFFDKVSSPNNELRFNKVNKMFELFYHNEINDLIYKIYNEINKEESLFNINYQAVNQLSITLRMKLYEQKEIFLSIYKPIIEKKELTKKIIDIPKNEKNSEKNIYKI